MMGQMNEDRLIAFTRMGDLEDCREFHFPDIRGWKVLSTTDHEVGKVEEVFVDPNTLEPGWVLLNFRKFLNFNTKSLLVPWSELRLGEGTVHTRPSEEPRESEADMGPIETEEELIETIGVAL
jgi:hypothetical protein